MYVLKLSYFVVWICILYCCFIMVLLLMTEIQDVGNSSAESDAVQTVFGDVDPTAWENPRQRWTSRFSLH